jgi:hypothetical protein
VFPVYCLVGGRSHQTKGRSTPSILFDHTWIRYHGCRSVDGVCTVHTVLTINHRESLTVFDRHRGLTSSFQHWSKVDCLARISFTWAVLLADLITMRTVGQMRGQVCLTLLQRIRYVLCPLTHDVYFFQLSFCLLFFFFFLTENKKEVPWNDEISLSFEHFPQVTSA